MSSRFGVPEIGREKPIAPLRTAAASMVVGISEGQLGVPSQEGMEE